MAAFRAVGAGLELPLGLGLLASGYIGVGRAEEGQAILDEALAIAAATDQRHYEAELHRLKGECALALAGEREGEAEKCFLQALEIARRQGAKLWELRAVMRWSRLLQTQGKGGEARCLLAATLGWFGEGFDTRDLRQARELVGALRAPFRDCVPDQAAAGGTVNS